MRLVWAVGRLAPSCWCRWKSYSAPESCVVSDTFGGELVWLKAYQLWHTSTKYLLIVFCGIEFESLHHDMRISLFHICLHDSNIGLKLIYVQDMNPNALPQLMSLSLPHLDSGSPLQRARIQAPRATAPKLHMNSGWKVVVWTKDMHSLWMKVDPKKAERLHGSCLECKIKWFTFLIFRQDSCKALRNLRIQVKWLDAFPIAIWFTPVVLSKCAERLWPGRRSNQTDRFTLEFWHSFGTLLNDMLQTYITWDICPTISVFAGCSQICF